MSPWTKQRIYETEERFCVLSVNCCFLCLIRLYKIAIFTYDYGNKSRDRQNNVRYRLHCFLIIILHRSSSANARFFNKHTDGHGRQTISNMNEIIKVIHMKMKLPHGWYAACGRPITSNTAVVSSWFEVTCKNCKLEEVTHHPEIEYSSLTATTTSGRL